MSCKNTDKPRKNWILEFADVLKVGNLKLCVDQTRHICWVFLMGNTGPGSTIMSLVAKLAIWNYGSYIFTKILKKQSASEICCHMTAGECITSWKHINTVSNFILVFLNAYYEHRSLLVLATWSHYRDSSDSFNFELHILIPFYYEWNAFLGQLQDAHWNPINLLRNHVSVLTYQCLLLFSIGVYRKAKHSPDFHKPIFNKEWIFQHLSNVLVLKLECMLEILGEM